MKFNYTGFENYLEVLLAQDVIKEWRKLTEGAYRINEDLDIWPRRNKYHSFSGQAWGKYDNLESFIRLIF